MKFQSAEKPLATVLGVTWLLTLNNCGRPAAAGGAESNMGAGNTTDTNSPARYFASETSLPPCDPTTDGWLVYVGSSRTFKACSAGEWTDIDLTGPQGDPGPQGPAGTVTTSGPIMAGTTSNGSDDISVALATIAEKQMAFVDIECFYGRGSGVIIDATTILTAFHVIDGESSCAYRASGVPIGNGGTFRRSSSGRDIGYIENINFSIDVSTIPAIPMLRNANVAVGDTIVLVSYPEDIINDSQVTVGRVTDDDVSNSLGSLATEWAGAIVSDAAAGPGSSGGPIFNLAGEMIGIHVGGYSGAYDALDVPGLELNYQLIFEDGD